MFTRIVTVQFASSSSKSVLLKEAGINCGINFITIGSNRAPPGSKKMANAGMDLKISSIWSFAFFHSSSVRSCVVDLDIKCINSLLCLISCIRRFLLSTRSSTMVFLSGAFIPCKGIKILMQFNVESNLTKSPFCILYK